MNYAKALEKVMKKAKPVAGRTREELETAIAAITAQLLGPM